MQASVPELTDIASEPESTFKLYGDDAKKPGTFANSALMARRMVERGVRFVQIYHNNWDTHSNVAGRLPESMPRRGPGMLWAGPRPQKPRHRAQPQFVSFPGLDHSLYLVLSRRREASVRKWLRSYVLLIRRTGTICPSLLPSDASMEMDKVQLRDKFPMSAAVSTRATCSRCQHSVAVGVCRTVEGP